MTPPSNDLLLDLVTLLLGTPDSAARAAIIASAITEALPDSACIVHRVRAGSDAMEWAPIGFAGDVTLAGSADFGTGRLAASLLDESPAVLIYSAAETQREDYAHLHVTRTVTSLAYLPLLDDGRLLGAIEILSFSRGLHRQDLSTLTGIVALAPSAITGAEDTEKQRQNLLDSLHRMTQLYDLEKSLNATLELDHVTALAPEKVLAMLPCQAIHLWLFDGNDLRLMATSGYDPTIEVKAVQAAGEGYVADMAEEGTPVLIADPSDERLQKRNAAIAGQDGAQPVTGALLVPLMQDDAEVGVIEAINKEGGLPFDDDDEFFLTSIAETVSSALKNASLMFAERKLEILEALVHVSSEITSTLRLDRLLQIIVNSPQNVLPYERCSIALDHRDRLQLKAVSGMTNLPLGDAQIDRLHELLRWLSTQPARLHLIQRDAAEENGSSEIPEPVTTHFAAGGCRALYSLPLVDDQGRVGLLLYESSDPDFLDLPHIEMISILAGQATVAIRNALLYREVPLISLLEPLMQRKQALFRTSGKRRLTFALSAVALLLFLIFCPLPMRISGEAVVGPQRLATIAAPAAGNVTSVFAHEGQRVSSGDVLGAMNDWQWRMDLAAAEARYRAAMLTMENDLAHGSAQAGADRAQTEYLRSEVNRARGKLESAQLRSPIAGIVITPALQNAAGEHLDAGAPFAQVLDLTWAVIGAAVPQGDAALVRTGQSAVVKLDSYPQITWRGTVAIVSPQAQAADGVRTFAARIPLPNTDALLRTGMSGRAKIFIGFRPAGYVLLRRPALWLWQTLWDWVGW